MWAFVCLSCYIILTSFAYSHLSSLAFSLSLLLFTSVYFLIRFKLQSLKCVHSKVALKLKQLIQLTFPIHPLVVDRSAVDLFDIDAKERDNKSDCVSIDSERECVNCGNHQCNSLDEENVCLVRPWQGLYVNKQINEELEQLLMTIYDQFVQSWYKELDVYFVSDQKFKFELQNIFKHVFAVCVKRLKTINLKKTISSKLLPTLIQHFYVYLEGKRSAKAQQFIERSALKKYDELGLLQPQLRSDSEETKWLRNLGELLLPFILPPKALHSNLGRTLVREIVCGGVLKPTIAMISDPFYVNDLLSVIFDPDAPSVDLIELEKANMGQPDLVPFLTNLNHWKQRLEAKHLTNVTNEFNFKNCFGIDLNRLIKDQQMLFLLLRYLKDEGCVNLLQFILTIDSFNEKILNPDLSNDDRKELHADAYQICNSYFTPNEVDYIDCLDEKWEKELQEILEKGPERIDELRKTDILFKSYERVYSYLEHEHLPFFFESDLYIKLVIGSRAQLDSTFNETNNAIIESMTRFSNDLAIQASESDDKLLSDSDAEEEGSDKTSKNEDELIFDYGIDLIELLNNTDGSSEEQSRQDVELKDLSTWRVKIEKVETKLEQNSFKYFYVYVLRVTQIDTPEDVGDLATQAVFKADDVLNTDESLIQKGELTWFVERKYDEFYVLDEKLRKFHGNALDSISGLTPKRTLFKQSLAFLEGRRRQFEKYVQALLASSRFQRSELLYNFLKPAISKKHQDIFNSRMVGLNIKKMIKTVPAKFSQEKGQHLDTFLTNFISSTEPQKVRGNVPDLKSIFNYIEDNNKDSSDDCDSIQSNLNTFILNFDPPTALISKTHFASNWMYDYLIFFLTRVCLTRSLRTCFVFAFRLFQPILKPTFDFVFDLFLDRKISEFLTAENVVYSLKQLRLSLLAIDMNETEALPAYTANEAQAKSKQSLANMQKYSELLFERIPLLNSPQNTIYFIHSVFQHTLLNKQLLYLLLSLLLEDVFPEIVEIKS